MVGFYEDGHFGIRIENLLVVVKKDKYEYKGREYLGFQRLTQIPIQKKMMVRELLNEKEIRWVNDYHDSVWNKISPLLQNTPTALSWLRENTSPL